MICLTKFNININEYLQSFLYATFNIKIVIRTLYHSFETLLQLSFSY